MNIEALHIGMKVRHPQYGVGVVRSLSEKTAEIGFDDAPRTIAPASSDLQPAEPTASLSELEMPLANLVRDTAHALVEAPWVGTKGCGCRRSGDSMAARNAGHATGGEFASAERSSTRDILSQDRDDSQQSASSRTKGERERQTERRR
jgi:hypothetical protein